MHYGCSFRRLALRLHLNLYNICTLENLINWRATLRAIMRLKHRETNRVEMLEEGKPW